MIVEAALYANDPMANEPPYELGLAWQLQRWRALPEPGGLFDQPLALMRRAGAALYAYEAFTARNNAQKSTKFAEKYPEIVAYCAQVEQWADELEG